MANLVKESFRNQAQIFTCVVEQSGACYSEVGVVEPCGVPYAGLCTICAQSVAQVYAHHCALGWPMLSAEFRALLALSCILTFARSAMFGTLIIRCVTSGKSTNALAQLPNIVGLPTSWSPELIFQLAMPPPLQ